MTNCQALENTGIQIFFFLFLQEKNYCGIASGYLQHMFLWRNEENINTFWMKIQNNLSRPVSHRLILVLLNLDILAFANSVDPDQLDSEEAN